MKTINAQITYPCFPPYDCTQFMAQSTSAIISLTEGLTLYNSTVIPLGNLSAGSTVIAKWMISGQGNVTVTAMGFVNGYVPADVPPSPPSPAYYYTDLIGGMSSIIVL